MKEQKTRSKGEGVTSRDDYIITQALVYAILTIDALPKERRSVSNQSDMKRILDHLAPDEADLAFMIESTRRAMYGDESKS